MTPLLRPINQEAYTRALVRICIRLIVIDCRKHPEHYSYRPNGILDLALHTRRTFPELYGTLVYISKAVSTGMSLAQIRHAPIEYSIRTIAKRRPLSRRAD
jgi:hypothetical protein